MLYAYNRVQVYRCADVWWRLTVSPVSMELWIARRRCTRNTTTMYYTHSAHNARSVAPCALMKWLLKPIKDYTLDRRAVVVPLCRWRGPLLLPRRVALHDNTNISGIDQQQERKRPWQTDDLTRDDVVYTEWRTYTEIVARVRWVNGTHGATRSHSILYTFTHACTADELCREVMLVPTYINNRFFKVMLLDWVLLQWNSFVPFRLYV